MDFFTVWSVPIALTSSSEKINIYSEQGQLELGESLLKSLDSEKYSKQIKGFAYSVVEFYKGRIDSTGTPFIYSLSYLLLSNDYLQSKFLFDIFNAFCLCLSIFIIGKTLKAKTYIIVVFLAVISAFYTPLISDIKVGNVGQILLLVLALYLWSESKQTRYLYLISGFFLGIGIAFKPLILPVFIFAVCLKLYKLEILNLILFISGTVASFIVAAGVTLKLFTNLTVWNEFFRSLYRTVDYKYSITHGNLSLSNFIYVLNGQKLSTIIFCTGLFLIVVVLTMKYLITGKRLQQCNTNFLSVAFGILLVLLSSPLVWIHYYLLLIPIFLYLIIHDSGQSIFDLFIGIAATVSLMVFIVINGIAIRFSPFIQTILVNSSLIAVYLVMLLKLYLIPFKSEQTDIR